MTAFGIFGPGGGTAPQPYAAVAGALLILLGLAMNLGSVGRFKNVGTNLFPHLDPQKLVTGGWFRITRNPMYLGTVLIVGGAGMATGNAFTLAVPAAFALCLDRLFIAHEEQAMLRVFGDDYVAYRKLTRRWI